MDAIAKCDQHETRKSNLTLDLWVSFFFFNLFYFLFLNFTILYWFCHISKWICHRYTCVPHPEPSSLLPSYPIPLGCPRALALGVLLYAKNSHWSPILHMVMCMFQCSSLKSSHPRLLPLSPKVCSLRLCLLCCPACRIIGTIFLNSICMSSSLFHLWFFPSMSTAFLERQLCKMLKPKSKKKKYRSWRKYSIDHYAK